MTSTPFVTRAEAGLRPPVGAYSNITPEGITAHYGGDSPWGDVDRSSPEAFLAALDHTRCASVWRAFQAWHMDHNGWLDIAYTSGVCPHGLRYEGRPGWARTAAQGTIDGNDLSLATCYMAGGDDPLTTQAMEAFADEAQRVGHPLRWVHSDWHSTTCPGAPITAWRDAGWPAPGAVVVAPPDPPTLPPPVPPPPPPTPNGDSYEMDTLDLRNAAAVPVRGRHVDNLQGLLLAAASFLHLPTSGLTGAGGVPDGIGGKGTRAALVDFQGKARYIGVYQGEADAICGPMTWQALIEF